MYLCLVLLRVPKHFGLVQIFCAGSGANPKAENDHNDNDDQNIGDNNNVLHNDENQNLQEMPPQNNNGVLWSQ